MTNKAYISGVGMVPFQKPGKSESYDVMAATATRSALADAGLDYDKVEQAYVGYVYGDSTSGQRALYHVGMTGIPVVNVNNNCSTGSSALFLARQAVFCHLRYLVQMAHQNSSRCEQDQQAGCEGIEVGQYRQNRHNQ